MVGNIVSRYETIPPPKKMVLQYLRQSKEKIRFFQLLQ
jgi:hypothetical protein